MISKKVCMVGSFSVGKTSLVKRYVTNIYDDRYLTTVGVKIDKKVVESDGGPVNMMLWDLAGEDAFAELRMDYIRGASGFILVVDGTRAETLGTALSLRDRIHKTFGPLPFVLAVNKTDRVDDWEVDEEQLDFLQNVKQWSVFRTSALSGDAVEDLFEHLASAMVHR